MDHHEVQERDLVNRYLLGLLPAAERARFEDHFVDCLQCLDDLELTRDFRQALRAGVAEEMARNSLTAGLRAWLARPYRGLVLGALSALVVSSAVWIVNGNRGSQPGDDVLLPQVNVPIHVLSSKRSPGAEQSWPAGQWMSLEMIVGELRDVAVYRVTVRDRNSVVWQRETPYRNGSVVATFPPGSLSAGEFSIELEGLSSSGEVIYSETHAFRLTG